MTAKQQWELKSHSYQIADTGDYDGYWEITNGKVSIYTKDDNEDSLQEVVGVLNDTMIDIYLEDAKEEAKFAWNEVSRLHGEIEGLSAATPPDVEQMAEYLSKRIAELNEADASFCKDRWDENKPKWHRQLAREQSNAVTLARQELENVLKKLEAGQSAVRDATVFDLLNNLTLFGGKVVAADGLSEDEINSAINEDRVYKTQGLGLMYVWMPEGSQDATPQEWEKALIGLTPGGSEYVGDPARCVEAVKDFRDIQHSQIVKLTKELSTLRSELSAAQEENKKLREGLIGDATK